MCCDSIVISICTLGDLVDKSVQGLVRSVCELEVQSLVSHVLADDSGVSSQAGHHQTDVIIDLEQLFLVFCQLRWQSLQTTKYDVIVGFETETDGALLDGFHSVLDLEEFSLRGPCGAV